MPGSNTHSTVYDDENHQQQPEEQPVGAPETTKTTPPEKTDGGVSSYDEIIDNINKEIAKNEKQYEQDRKIDAVVAAINGIGDMSRALGNIYATTKYAPSSFNPSTSESNKYGERAAKAKAEYDKNRSALMSYLNKYKKEKSDFNIAKEKQRLAQEKWEAEEERKNALNQAKVESYNAMTLYREAIGNKNDALAKKYEADVLYLQAKLKYLELGYNLKQAEAQARIDAEQALAEKRRREANGTTTSTTIERDMQGNEVGRTTTKTTNSVGNGGGDGGKKQNPMGGNNQTGRGKKKNPMG